MVLKVGDAAEFSKTFLESDVYKFAEVSGDYNPIHIDFEMAKKSVFGKRVVHGLLAGSLISTVIGTRLPGPGTIYMEQDMRFVRPVFIGDSLLAKVSVEDILNEEKGIVRLATAVFNQYGEEVIKGYAIVKVK